MSAVHWRSSLARLLNATCACWQTIVCSNWVLLWFKYVFTDVDERLWIYNLIIRSSEKFVSFYKEIMDAQHFPFYIILSNYVWSILLYQDKDYNVRQIRFHVCIKMHRCKRRVRKRKTLLMKYHCPGFWVILRLWLRQHICLFWQSSKFLPLKL